MATRIRTIRRGNVTMKITTRSQRCGSARVTVQTHIRRRIRCR